MSISKEIERLQQAKKDIGDAIVRKGGSVSGTIDTYAKSIMSLGDVSFRTAIDIVNKSDAQNVDLTMISPKNETSLKYLFYGNTNLININVSNWDTSNITIAHGVFAGCSNLNSLDLSSWDTSNIVSFYNFLGGCESLQSIDISHFNTTSTTNTSWMFTNCKQCKEIDVSCLSSAKITEMKGMFIGCSSLTHIDISMFDTSKLLNIEDLLSYCGYLDYVDISHLDLSHVVNITRLFTSSYIDEIRCDGLQLPNIDMSNIGLNSSKKLTVDNIVGLLNSLPQSDKGYSFQIGSDNIAKLSDEQKAIATDKGWTLI